MTTKAYMVPNPPLPNRAIEFNETMCNGCDYRIEVCRNDVLMPNPEKTKPPIVLYPEECWYCGLCVEECPGPGSISMHHPLRQMLAMRWVRKSTGEEFRVGMRNPPPPSSKRPSGEPYKAIMAPGAMSMELRGVVKTYPCTTARVNPSDED
jgi:NAD-dependent dihydropyrimidine dehydrogenase PreA subunit